jgi:hypothetical protein
VIESPAAGRRSPLARWAGLGGILYVAFVAVGLVLSYRGPDTDAPPQRLMSYWSDDGHRDQNVLGWFLIIIGVFFFIWFLAALRRTVVRLAGDEVLTAVTTVGGAVYAALTVVAFSINTALKTMSDDTYRDQVFPELIHAADDASYVLHSAGGVGAAAMIIGASLAALQARAVPASLGWLSVVAGLTAIVSIFFIPWFIIAVWIVIASVLVTRSHWRAAA